MHGPIERDMLLIRADAAIALARLLENQLSDHIAVACAQCRRTEQHEAFLADLNPAVAISLLASEKL